MSNYFDLLFFVNADVCDLYNIEDNVLPFSDHIRHDTRLKYDQHISLIVHKAYTRAVLILKCFHFRDPSILMQDFSVYVRPLLEFSSQVWSPHHKYLIDKVESVQRFFTINVYQDFEGYLIVRD